MSSPGRSSAELEDALVMEVVAHLVEGHAAVLSQSLHRNRMPALDDLGRHLLSVDADDAQVAQRRELRQQVDGVVGDAGAHRRQRRDEVEREIAPARRSQVAGLAGRSGRPGHVSSRSGTFAAAFACAAFHLRAQERLDERIDVAVEDAVGVAHLGRRCGGP